MNPIAVLFLGVYLLIEGIVSVSNTQLLWANGIRGYSALIAGFIVLVSWALGYIATHQPPKQ